MSKTLMCAVEFDIFTKLSGKSLTMRNILKLLNLPHRHGESFIAALISLGLLTFKSSKKEKSLMNSRLSDVYLVRGKSTYIGDFITMYDKRLYRKWEGLASVLKPQDSSAESLEKRTAGMPFSTLDDLYDQVLLKKEETEVDGQADLDMFVRAMYGEKLWEAITLCKIYDFSRHKKMIDLGGGPAVFSIQIVTNFSNISALVIDTVPVCEIANEYIKRFNVQDRVRTQTLDFVKESLPKGYDAIFMSHIIGGMSKKKNISILRKAYESLPKTGTVIINEWLLNDDKGGPKMPALMGLNMLLETNEGKSYSFAEICEMLTEVGFVGIEKKPISNSPGNIIIGYKN